MARLQLREHSGRIVRMAGAPDARESDGRTGLGERQDVIDLMFTILHRHRRHHDAEPRAREVDHELLDAVGQLHHHDVVALEPLLHEYQAQALDRFMQLAPGGPLWRAMRKVVPVRRVHHGLGVRTFADVLQEQLPQGGGSPPAAAGVFGDFFVADQDHVQASAGPPQGRPAAPLGGSALHEVNSVGAINIRVPGVRR